MNIKNNLTSIALALILAGGNSTALYADDTDIYLAPPNVIRDDNPNIMIIIDNSRSMETESVEVGAAYSSSTTYSGSFDSGFVYWVNNGAGQPTTVPTSGVISKTDLLCGSASIISKGRSIGLKISQWSGANGSSGNWQTPSPASTNPIECKADDNTDTTNGGNGTGQYAYKIGSTLSWGSGQYTNSTNSNKQVFSNSNSSLWVIADVYDGNYLNFTEGGGGATTLYSRMEFAQLAMKEVIDTVNNVNLGLMTFNRASHSDNGGGRVVHRIVDLNSANRTSLKNTISLLRGSVDPTWPFPGPPTGTPPKYSGVGNNPIATPLTETLYEAYKFFSGGTVTFGGINWKNNDGSSGLVNPVPYPDVCAEDDSNSSYCAPYVYSPTSGGIDRDGLTAYYTSVTGDGTYITPFRYQCQKAFILLVTDGDPAPGDTKADSDIDALVGTTKYETKITYTYLDKTQTPAVTVSVAETSDTSQQLGYDPYATGTPGTPRNSRLDDLAGYMANNDLVPDGTLPGIQEVKTYTVGMQGISTNGQRLLRKTAYAGGGKFFDASNANSMVSQLQTAINDIKQVTSSFAAPALSVNAFNKLFNRDEIYFALFQPSSSVSWDGNIKKLRLCNREDEASASPAPCKFGEIVDRNLKPAIDPADQRIRPTSVSFWNTVQDGGDVTKGGTGLAIQTQGPAGRNIYTYRGSYASLPASMELITSATTNTFYTAALATPSILDSSGTLTAAGVRTTIDWMRGFELDGATKRWPFGDPLHSRPVALTFGAHGGDKTDPIIKLFVSTNDGQIHVLNDATGREEWAFYPKELLDKQYSLSQDGDGAHKYGADGSPTFWIEDLNNDGILDKSAGDFAYMYIGMRRGGKNIYAFDLLDGYTGPLTDKNSNTLTPKLIWAIEGGVTTGFSRLGQTWSAPQVRKIKMKCNGTGCAAGDAQSKTVLIFGGGYDTGQDTGDFTGAATTNPYGNQSSGVGNAIYIVDPSNGSLIWWASSAATANLVLSEMIYAIPSDISLFDTNGDGAVDRLFFGDMGGLVWRIDLGDQLDVGSNGGSKGYVFADLVCKRDPSTNARDCTDTAFTTLQSWRKVFYNPDVTQVRDSVYSTVSDYDVIVVSTGNRADPVDKQSINASKQAVHNAVFALRDYNIATGPYATTAPIALDKEDFMDLTDNQLQDPAAGTYATDLATIKGKKGWYVWYKETTAITVPPLVAPATTTWVGEKGLAKPVIFDGVIYVSTYTPANDATAGITCASTEGLGKLRALGLYNATAVIDFDGDGTPDRETQTGGGIPSELVTVIREGGVTGLVGTSGGAANPNIGEELPRGKTYWYEE